MFDKLPQEILDIILRQIKSQVDLKSLSETSKFLHHAALPLLYESITIAVPTDRDVPAIAESASRVPLKYLKYLKHIRFKLDQFIDVNSACPHSWFSNLSADEQWEIADYWYARLEPMGVAHSKVMNGLEVGITRAENHLPNFWLMAAAPMLQSLEPNTLLSFSWDMSACPPAFDAQYGCFDLLQEHQRSIENISLMMDPSCRETASRFHINLEQFPNIRSLSWIGLTKLHDAEMLAGFFAKSSYTIRSLTLDLATDNYYSELERDFSRVRRGHEQPFYPNIHPSLLFNLKRDSRKNMFPALTSLSLVGYDFGRAGREMTRALNLTELTSLKLVSCTYCDELFSALLESESPVKLKTLELLFDRYEQDNVERALRPLINRFLCSFRGLESLFLVLEGPDSGYSCKDVCEGSLNHESSLKRLVFPRYSDIPAWHNANRTSISTDLELAFERELSLESEPESESESEPESDSDLRSPSNSGTKPEVSIDERIDPGNNYLVMPNLKCLAVEGSPYIWQKRLQSWQPRPGWTLLHLRELYQYAASSALRPGDRPRTLPSKAIQMSHLGHVAVAPLSTNRSPYRSIRKFAKWAFSNQGLPQLQVLAYGDFSYEGRCAHMNMLVCRKGQPRDAKHTKVRPLSDRYSDHRLWELVSDNMDMLAACCVDSLFDEGMTQHPRVGEHH